jgi:hypothetical protein
MQMQKQGHTTACREAMRLALVNGLVVQAIASVLRIRLGVEDLVSDSRLRVDQLAAGAEANTPSLLRVLRALAGINLWQVRVIGQHPPRVPLGQVGLLQFQKLNC